MESHGKTIFTWSEDILYMEAFGPFNEEGTQETAATYGSIVSSRGKKKFSIIEIWDPETLGSPRAVAEMGKFWGTLNQAGCISLAIVVSTKTQEWIASNQVPAIGKVFFDKADAKDWVNQKMGYPPS